MLPHIHVLTSRSARGRRWLSTSLPAALCEQVCPSRVCV